MEGPNGLQEVSQYLVTRLLTFDLLFEACIRVHCFNQGKAEIVKSGLAAVGSVATGEVAFASRFRRIRT